MIEFIYAGAKAVLVTSDDLFDAEHKMPMTAVLAFWKKQIGEWRKSGIKAVFVVTTLRIESLPMCLRDILDETKSCYAGELE